MTTGTGERLARAKARIAAMVAAARTVSPTSAPKPPAYLVEMVGATRAAQIMAGIPNERAAQAIRNRKAVERMSRDGMRVQDIADAVGISYGYVVQLRGQLGVGRRR